jgi:hypothetical protein
VRSDEYCDEDGANCFAPADVTPETSATRWYFGSLTPGTVYTIPFNDSKTYQLSGRKVKDAGRCDLELRIGGTWYPITPGSSDDIAHPFQYTIYNIDSPITIVSGVSATGPTASTAEVFENRFSGFWSGQFRLAQGGAGCTSGQAQVVAFD